MKRRQIAALALACMLTLTSFTTYAENGTNPENPALLLDEDVSLETESETTEIETEESETAEGEETEAETEAAFEEETEMTSEEETENTAIETETEETEEPLSEEESDSSDTSEQKTEESVSETTLNSEASDGSQTVAAALTETTEEPQIESETESEFETEEQTEAVTEPEIESESEAKEQTEPETEEVTSEEDTGDEFILTKDNEGDFLDKFDSSISRTEELCLNYIEYGKIEGIEEIYYCLWDDEFCYSFSGLPFTHAFTDLSYASDYTGFGKVFEYYGYGLDIWLQTENWQKIVTKDVTLGILLVKDDGSYTWDTVRIYGNENAEYVDMISPHPDEYSYLHLISNKINEFTLIYPEGVNKEDIEAIGYCLWDDGCAYSIGDMPYMHGLSCWGYYGDAYLATGYVTEDGFVIIPEKYWEYTLSVCIRCKDGRTFYDGIRIDFDEEYVAPDNGIHSEYAEYWIYLEKGQTAYVDARELGFCEDRYIGTFIGMDYDTYSEIWYESLDQDPKIKMNRFTFENVKTGLEFVAEKNGETIFWINCSCLDKDSNESDHCHRPIIGVIISESGKGEYAPGIYERFGNLIRAFDEDIVSNDQNTRPGAETSESQSAVTPNTSSSKVDSPTTGDSDMMRIMFFMLLCACGIVLVYLAGKREKQ